MGVKKLNINISTVSLIIKNLKIVLEGEINVIKQICVEIREISKTAK